MYQPRPDLHDRGRPALKTSVALRIALLILGVAVPLAWTMGRPPSFDEVNFLTLARGAVADPWRPHAVTINWQGSTESAFAVLSNPPGIAWWLAPVMGLPVWVQRAWMLPWLVMAAWGSIQLGQRFIGHTAAGAIVLVASPIVILSATALTPDAPLYAITLAGMAGYVRAVERGSGAAPWALLIGFAAWFRYSGLALWPAVLLWPFLQRRPLLPALAVVVPTALLITHDLAAYDRLHLLAMTAFQAVANTPLDWGHKALASVAMLGGAVVLPVYRWRRRHAVVAALGALAAWPWGPVAMGFAALGGAALAPILDMGRHTKESATTDRIFLATWALVGCAFLLTLRFTAARYWLPFLAPVALLLPADALRLRVGLGLGLGVFLSLDAALHARGEAALAAQVSALGRGGFAGHWGWQGALEAAGWTALDEGSTPEPGTLVAIPQEAWPQHLNVRCDRIPWEGQASPPLQWLPRGYSRNAAANLHSNWIAGPTPLRTVIPWWFAHDAYEQARVCAE